MGGEGTFVFFPFAFAFLSPLLIQLDPLLADCVENCNVSTS